MKAKVLIFSIILSLNFANNCEAQILGDIISAAMRKKAEKKKQKKQKKQKEQTNTDEIHMLLESSEFNDDKNDLMPAISEEIDKQVTIKKEENKPNVNVKSNDDVALTVSADGATKEEATKIALRSAIEQAYGTFVSANSTILNDDMVKEEIVTISNGNIKSYQEIASAILPNGRTTVTLNAVVSISKLTSFAKSKGASTEFAGATFAMNVKMRELNKKNEMKALDNLMIQVENLIPMSFDRSLVIGEPELCTKNSLPYTFLEDNKQINPDNYYVLPLSIQYRTNENIKDLLKLIYSTLCAIEPTEEEYDYFKTHSTISFDLADHFNDRLNYNIDNKSYFRTRLNRKQSNYYEAKMTDIFINYFTDFEIIDNTGAVSSFNAKLWGYYANGNGTYSYIKEEYYKEEYDRLQAMIKNGKKIPLGYYYGTGIFNPIVYQRSGAYSVFKNMFSHLLFDNVGINISRFFTWDYFVLIPKENIAKYSNFTIQPKTK